MICPFCESETRIYNSRGTHGKTQTWRRHRCRQCALTFTTKEKIDWDGAIRVKTDESTQPYNRERLLLSLLKASSNITLPPGTLGILCDNIEYQLQINDFFKRKTSSSQQIVEIATTTLQRYNPNLALQYVNSVYRNQPPVELVRQLLAPPSTPKE